MTVRQSLQNRAAPRQQNRLDRMKLFRGILVIGIIEILIGGLTLVGTFGAIILGISTKTPNVLFFVITAATVSTLIGVGILQLKAEAYHLLLYFSSVILLSKILFLFDIIHLNGTLATAVPVPAQNIISFLYHGYVIYYLRKEDVRPIFVHGDIPVEETPAEEIP